MRLGVLDVGSNTVHLLVVDAQPGGQPLPAYSHKAELYLAQHLDASGAISDAGHAALQQAVQAAMVVAEDQGCQDVVAFATSALRDASNSERVLSEVRAATGVDLQVLSGPDEARLTFLAVRRWFGWSSGRLLVLDIGGGSLEIAAGLDEEPQVALSLPLGAGRLTRDRLPGDPPGADAVRDLRRYVRVEIGRIVRDVTVGGTPGRVVGSSKTLRSLARIAGARPSGDGPFAVRTLSRDDAATWADRLAEMSVEQRAELPGVTAQRAPQSLAGAVVADAAMDLLGVSKLEICPWALREGVILRRLDWLAASDRIPTDATAARD